ncbi:MAG: aminoacyl-tRNA hydrolase [Alphaproteobacteria bacterium]|nr:aminoacyl-tRNA hydrolase [Alphaproteobacteria bacterium]
MSQQSQKMIVGLGNPGADYARNRHNIGFMALDALATAWDASAWQKKFKAQVAQASWEMRKLLLLKPQTYMNLSGQAVAEALHYYKLEPKDVIVIQDDIDLLAGQVKCKQGGGHGGHNGLRSLDEHIGKDYWRVRLGIGHPGQREDVTDHVLSNFSAADKIWLELLLEDLPKALPALFDGNQARFLAALKKETTP